MKNLAILPLISLIFLAGSCSIKVETDANIITQRIQYDVSIKSPDPELDWWVQNIEGEKRETLVQHLMTAVTGGNVKAYNFISNKQLSVKEINEQFHRSDTIAMQRPYPPYDFYDTVINKNLDTRNITRLRFLEEWRMDEKTLAFTKKVIGICPLIEAYTEQGELKGYKPLFWVFFDDQYPGKFELNK